MDQLLEALVNGYKVQSAWMQQEAGNAAKTHEESEQRQMEFRMNHRRERQAFFSDNYLVKGACVVGIAASYVRHPVLVLKMIQAGYQLKKVSR